MRATTQTRCLRRVLAVAVALILSTAGVTGTASADAEPPTPNWMLMKITAGPEGATGVSWSSFFMGTTKGEPFTIGEGQGGSHSRGPIWVDGYLGPTEITTTEQLGGLRITLLPGNEGGTLWGARGYGEDRLEPGETVATLLFAVGLEPLQLSMREPRVETGHVEVEVQEGHGSQQIIAADPTSQGHAVSAAGLAAGMSTTEVHSTSGLAGGMVNDLTCIYCEGRWTSPDGRSETWATPTGRTGHTYAGPSGAWSWTWTGLGYGHREPVVLGAWAPIGDDWTLFAEPQ